MTDCDPLAEVTSVDSFRRMSEERSRLAAKLSRFAGLGLAHLPTPLEPMKRLTEHLGGPRLWVKREDATAIGFGGNKLRKLDYVLHEAMAGKADTLVSGGVVQSNSQLQVAAAAAKLGLQCHLAVYHGRLLPPTPEYETSGNAFLNRCSVPICTMFPGPAIAMARSGRWASGYARKGGGPILSPMEYRMCSAPLAMLRP